MTEPASPGTQPELVRDPIEGRDIVGPRFDFPLGLDGKNEVGPYGPRPTDERPIEGVPFLGIPRTIGVPRTFTLSTSLGTPVSAQALDVSKPTMLLLYRNDLAAVDVSVNVLYFPGIAFEQYLDDNNGLKTRGPDLFLFAPGRWYLGAIVTTFVRKLTYLMVECENPEAFDFFRDQQGCFVNQLSHVVLPAATVTTLVDLPTIVKTRRITLQNTSAANSVFWTYGSATPSATRGTLLAPLQTQVIEGPDLMMSQIRGFSTAGANVAITRDDNPWHL